MPLKRHLAQLEDEVRVLAGMDVGSMWDRFVGEFLDEWARLDRQRLSDADMLKELASFMDKLSDKPVEDIARQSAGVSYNQGRRAEILSQAKKIAFVVRSEVLDTRTCQTCSVLDGEVFEIGTPEFEEFMPPAKCDGGDRCRGIYIAVPGGM